MIDSLDREISAILSSLKKLKGRHKKEDGSLNVESFNEDEVVVQAVEDLKNLGIMSSNDLMKRGFVAAGMILHI